MERALQREGVREAPDMEVLEENISKSKKRGRTSISGIVLSRADSIEMIREAESVTTEKSMNLSTCIYVNARVEHMPFGLYINSTGGFNDLSLVGRFCDHQITWLFYYCVMYNSKDLINPADFRDVLR